MKDNEGNPPKKINHEKEKLASLPKNGANGNAARAGDDPTGNENQEGYDGASSIAPQKPADNAVNGTTSPLAGEGGGKGKGHKRSAWTWKKTFAVVAIAVLGAGLYWGFNWHQQQEAKKIALQHQQEEQRRAEEARARQAKILDDTAQWITERGLKGEKERPSLFTAEKLSGSQSWKLLRPLSPTDGLKVPDGPFKAQPWDSGKIAVNPERLKPLFVELLRGNYFPGTQPMIGREDWTTAIEIFQQRLTAAADVTGTPLSEADAGQIKQNVREVLQKPDGNEHFAFIWKKQDGSLKIRFVDPKGDAVYERCFLAEGTLVLTENALSHWISRLKGSLKVEPWVEPTEDGNIILHGQNLPEWSRENQSAATDQFAAEIARSLEEETQ